MKILVAVDGSEYSQNALLMAAKLPFKDPQFQIIHVISPISYDPNSVIKESIQDIKKFNAELESQSNILLNNSLKIMQDRDRPASIETLIGHPAEVILKKSEESDLIIMGARGLNPVASFFLGSVSDSIINQAKCPVLLNRSASEASFDTPSILVGYDDTPSSRDACHFLKNFDPSKVNKVDLVCAVQLNFYYGMSHSLAALEQWPSQKKSLEESMVATSRNIESFSKDFKVNTDVIYDAYSAADDLIEYAEKHHNDIIMVGSKGKSMIDRVFLGSTSTRLASHANGAVLIVR